MTFIWDPKYLTSLLRMAILQLLQLKLHFSHTFPILLNQPAAKDHHIVKGSTLRIILGGACDAAAPHARFTRNLALGGCNQLIQVGN
jgi:hypothetical protein